MGRRDYALARAGKAVREATAAAKRRDDTIGAAHACGATIRDIAAETGLSSARVHQILHGR